MVIDGRFCIGNNAQPYLPNIRVNGHLWWSKPLKPLIALALKQMKNMNKKSAFIVIVK